MRGMGARARLRPFQDTPLAEASFRRTLRENPSPRARTPPRPSRTLRISNGPQAAE